MIRNAFGAIYGCKIASFTRIVHYKIGKYKKGRFLVRCEIYYIIKILKVII